MKRIAAFVAIFVVLVSLSSCNLKPYRDDYEEGYDDGYYCGLDKGWDLGYDEGHSDGYDEGSKDGWIDYIEEPGCYFEWDASHHAKEQTGWHPEEARMIIDAYQNSEPFWEDGSPPTQKEYIEAIDTLICFYEYFYCEHYK